MPETKHTFCRICEACCGIDVDVEDGRVVGIRPDREHVVTRGYACIKGIRYEELHESPDRLRYPMERVGDRWERRSWDEAFRRIGDKVQQLREAHGPDAIGAYIGNPVAFCTTHPIFMNAFLQGIGTRNVFSAGSQDCNNKFLVAQRMYGSAAIQPIPDFDRTDCFVCIGSNPAVSHSSIVQFPRPVERLRAIERRGGTVWHVNPRKTETARLVGRQVFIRPDTDVFFLAAFANELLRTGGVDRARVRRHMKGFEAFERVVAPWTPERCAEATGIEAALLREMVTAYKRARDRGRGGVLYCSTGLNQTRHGALAYWLLNVVNAVSGNLDAEGGAVVPRGMLDVPGLMKKAGLGSRTDRSRIGGFESIMDTSPAGVLPDEILTPGPGRMRALFVSAGNPLLSCPDERRLEEALRDLELLVSIDMFRNETAELAHWVLPAASFLERPDLPLATNGFAPEPYLQYTDAVVEPDGEQRDEMWIYENLCRACGVPAFGSRIAGAMLGLGRAARGLPVLGARIGLSSESVLGAMVAASGKATLGKLRRHPHGLRLPPNRSDDFLSKRVLTDDGKVDLAPPDLATSAGDMLEQAFAAEQQDGDALRLISKREKHGHNTWLHNAPSMVAKGRDTNRLYMHPRDARERGLSDGDLAQVATPTATVEAPVQTTDELMPGTVALPHGWGHGKAGGLRVAQRAAGVNVNRLAGSGPDGLAPFTGMTQLNGIRVRVARADQHAPEPVIAGGG